MADNQYTSTPIAFNAVAFNGGLNTTAGPFAVSEAESPDLQNIDFDIFGSILKRNGYLNLSSASLGAFNSDGVHWFESDSSRQLVNVADGKFYKMDVTVAGEPDTWWDDASNGWTLTADNLCDFTNWKNKCFVTNGIGGPFVYNGTTLTTATLPATVTRPKYIEQFENYLFYLNVYVSNVAEGSRFYWSDLNDETTWDAANFIRVSDRDGTQITGAKRLADRLVVFKDRAIYNVFATFDPDVPFTVQRSNSPNGCVSAYSIQEVQNGIVFLSQDGFYYYDGNNSMKISDKISVTLRDYDFTTARSAVYYDKNRYLCSMADSSGVYSVFVWDFQLNAWSIYKGMTISAMTRAYINGRDERVYFADNAGWVYRMDYGVDDYPLGVQTAINAYWYSNWKPMSDLILQKSFPIVVIYYRYNDCTLQFSYSYDFNTDDQYMEEFSLSDTSSLSWDLGSWDVETWAKDGGAYKVFNLTGRGRVARFGFKNNTIGETFRIDGLGLQGRGETDRG